MLLVIGVLLGLGVYFATSVDQRSSNEREFITSDVKHSIPLEEILDGCSGRDCIPSIEDPEFANTNSLPEWFDEEGLGISLEIGDDRRFYPYQVLVSHEIVNDSLNEQPVAVTYCPLCFSGIVFDREVAGEILEFGVSGKLHNSNLLMYDRTHQNLWSQISGEAVVGDKTGTELRIVPSDVVTFSEWQDGGNGEVLVGDSTRLRNYASIPYGGDLTDIPPFFDYANADDTRLPYNAFVLGIIIDGQAKAYHVDAIVEQDEIVDEFAGKTIVGKYDSSTGATRLFERTETGDERIDQVFTSFWFSWAATHKESELYK